MGTKSTDRSLASAAVSDVWTRYGTPVAGNARMQVRHLRWLEGNPMPKLERYQRVSGAARTKLAVELKRQYQCGRSIRELAREYDRSYNFIHGMLTEGGVPLRGRGGPMNRKKPSAGET
jgi:hypothetical protein